MNQDVQSEATASRWRAFSALFAASHIRCRLCPVGRWGSKSENAPATAAAAPAPAAAGAKPAAAPAPASGKVGPGMNAQGQVMDTKKVEEGYGRRSRGLEAWEGEITGMPVPGANSANSRSAWACSRRKTSSARRPTRAATSPARHSFPGISGPASTATNWSTRVRPADLREPEQLRLCQRQARVDHPQRQSPVTVAHAAVAACHRQLTSGLGKSGERSGQPLQQLHCRRRRAFLRAADEEHEHVARHAAAGGSQPVGGRPARRRWPDTRAVCPGVQHLWRVAAGQRRSHASAARRRSRRSGRRTTGYSSVSAKTVAHA